VLSVTKEGGAEEANVLLDGSLSTEQVRVSVRVRVRVRARVRVSVRVGVSVRVR